MMIAQHLAFQNRAVLEPILVDLDRLWEMRFWLSRARKAYNPKQTASIIFHLTGKIIDNCS